jgi:integrase
LEAKALVDDGIDPRDLASGVLSVRQLVESYLAKHVRPNLRSARAVERRLSKNMLPLIGGLAVSALHKRDINRVLDSVAARDCLVEPARVFQDMRALFRWAVARGDLDHNPMEGMRTPQASKPRERVLSDEEVRALWQALPEALPRSEAVQQIIKLCLLTAQRVGEVSGMHRNELDLDAGVWTIPAARSKNKRRHTVPLSAGAMAIIATRGDHYLFPNDEGTGPLSGHAVAKTIRLAQERFGLAHWTAHDLRRTAVTNMAKLGVSPIVLGHVINHISVTKAGVTLSVYSQYDYAKEKREALELWADRLEAIVAGTGANVVRLKA